MDNTAGVTQTDIIARRAEEYVRARLRYMEIAMRLVEGRATKPEAQVLADAMHDAEHSLQSAVFAKLVEERR